MDSEYCRLISDYEQIEGDKDIRFKPKKMSIEEHKKILLIQNQIVAIDKYGYLLSEYFIEDWDKFRKLQYYYKVFVQKYFI